MAFQPSSADVDRKRLRVITRGVKHVWNLIADLIV